MKTEFRFFSLGAVTLLGSLLFWNGCNSSDSTPSNDPAPSGNTHPALINACNLLTNAEATLILGKPVLSVKGDTLHYVTHCSFIGDTAVGYFLPSHVDVTVSTTAGMQAQIPGTPTTAASLFNSVKARTTEVTQLTGIGSDAVWQQKPGKVSFVKADVYVDVVYSPNGKAIDTSAVAEDGAKAAAVKVAEKL